MATRFAPVIGSAIDAHLSLASTRLSSPRESGIGISRESVWREPRRMAPTRVGDGFLVATHWMDDRHCGVADSAFCTPGRHEIAIAMKTTRLKLFRDQHTLFEGLMPAGTLYVADAALPLKIDFNAPCDFVHLSIPSAWLSDEEGGETAAGAPGGTNLDGFTMRDALAEGLARSLLDFEAEYGAHYAESVGRTIVMRLLGAVRIRAKNAGANVRPLPRWRLKRVQDYVTANIGESISLPKLASVAGLSRMHFAAQFRAATGYRPHEYLLYRRIEQAKALLSQGPMSLVEVALTVGFQSQAHFSTIFKRFTGQTPLGWRRESLELCARHPANPQALGKLASESSAIAAMGATNNRAQFSL